MAEKNKTTNKNGTPHPINMGILPDLIGFNLRCAQLAVFQHFNATVGTNGISAPQFGTLLLIEANPAISQSAIAKALRFDRSTLVQIIDRLEDAKLVTRHTSPTDRRSHALRLTDEGSVVLAKLKEVATSHENAIAGGLNANERKECIALLKKLYGGS